MAIFNDALAGRLLERTPEQDASVKSRTERLAAVKAKMVSAGETVETICKLKAMGVGIGSQYFPKNLTPTAEEIALAAELSAEYSREYKTK